MSCVVNSLLDTANDALTASEVRAAIQDDPTTILKVAAEIANNKGREPATCVTRACTEEVMLLEDADPVRVRQEVEACLLGKDVEIGLQWLQTIGAIALLFPELEACVHLEQEPGRHHKDVWEHTKLVVKQAVRRPVVRWAALLHDIGKVPTRRFTKRGVHFHGHAEVGARMFDKMCKRVPFDEPDRGKIRFLIKMHLRSNQYGADWSDSAVRRFGREIGEHVRDLLDLSRADITSKRPGRRRQLLFQISHLANRLDELQKRDAELPLLKPGIGNAIMKEFDLPAGKHLAKIRAWLEQAISDGELEARADDAVYIAWLRDKQLITQDIIEVPKRRR